MKYAHVQDPGVTFEEEVMASAGCAGASTDVQDPGVTCEGRVRDVALSAGLHRGVAGGEGG